MSQNVKAISLDAGINRLEAVVIPKHYPNGHIIDWHCHQHNQLVYASSGVMAVETELKLWVVPPQRAVWIPAYEKHKVYMYGDAAMKNVYLLPSIDIELPNQSDVLNVSPMLREMIIHLSEQPADQATTEPYWRIVQVLLDQLKVAPQASIQIPLPNNAKLGQVCNSLLETPADNRSLKQWAEEINVSSRTLSRLFRNEVGMSFIEYRQQARLFHSLTLLAQSHPVTTVAFECGFTSVSAFNHLFKQSFEVTPGRFFIN
ncbi:TPA: helix-turn-helix transcriptional regulator [Vibrio harveyi]|uniref:AraC family transcriptional regulator n=1 Tax=Vibrio harveyi TaxID=669 RepID=UPI00390B7BDC